MTLPIFQKKYGILDTDNPDALHTLLSLKTPGALVPNHNTLQVRLFVPKLLDPNYAPYLSCKNHMNIDEQFHQDFIKKIQKLAQRAYASCSLIKPVNMQKIETEECKFNQLRFFKRNNVEYSPVAQISQMRNENSMEELSSLFSNESPFDENSFS